jgi:hypothetical protein
MQDVRLELVLMEGTLLDKDEGYCLDKGYWESSS